MRPNKSDLIRHKVDCKGDTPFSAFARLLQSKWREKKGYPYLNWGSRLEIEFAKKLKKNFLTPNIRDLVTSSVENSKNGGAMISQPRIWDNLLSSQPLCFNLFGELHFDLDLATKFFSKVFPQRIDKVLAVKFEYSAGRENPKYSGDKSAFDVFVEYIKNGKRGFIGIEVKYAETLYESPKKAAKTFSNHKNRYTELTTGNIFKPKAIENFCRDSISQIWRDHILMIAHQQDYDEGFFVFLFPKKNINCQNRVDLYRQNLNSELEEQNGFYPRYLDDFILTLSKIHPTSWTTELQERYLGES